MPEFKQDEDITGREYLSKLAALKWEAETFASHHPEFYRSKYNSDLVTKYMFENKLPIDAEGFETAYQKLRARGKLVPGKEAVALMSPAQLEELIKTAGVPTTDPWGRTVMELPESLKEDTVDFNRERQKPGPVETMRRSRNVAEQEKYPWAKGKTISKATYAMLTSDEHGALIDFLQDNELSLEDVVR